MYKTIPGTCGLFQVNEKGEVRSTEGWEVTIWKNSGRPTLYLQSGWQISIHRAVAMAFLGLSEDDVRWVVNIDGDFENVHKDNLRVMTREEGLRFHKEQKNSKVSS